MGAAVGRRGHRGSAHHRLATVTTSMGSLQALLERPRGRRPGLLLIRRDGWGADARVRHAGKDGLRRSVSFHLTRAVIALVGG